MSHIAIVYCFDDKYADYAAVAMYSAFRHASRPVRFYCLVQGQSIETRASFVQMRAKHAIDIREIQVDPSLFSTWKTYTHLTTAMYLRLLIPQLIDEPRLLYLDVDTVVFQDPALLFDTDLGGQAIAGVLDVKSPENKYIELAPGDPYINSGVVLWDLDATDRANFLGTCSAIYDDNVNRAMFTDQCIMNKAFEGRKKLLDGGWNTFLTSNSLKIRDFAARIEGNYIGIGHFISTAKPWTLWCHPAIRDLFARIATEAGLTNLNLLNPTDLLHYLDLARAHDTNEEYKQASHVKGTLIDLLIAHLARQRAVS